MGMFHNLTSLLLAISFVWAQTPAVKHRRGEGLLPEKPAAGSPAAKPAPGKTAGSAVKSAEGRTLARPGQTTETTASASADPDALACEGVSLAKLFEFQQARQPDVAAEGAYFLRTEQGHGKVFLQLAANHPAQALETIPDVQSFRSSPDRKSLFVLSPLVGTRRGLYLWQGEGKPVIPVATDGIVSAASWSPDNQWIAFTSNRTSAANFELYRYDIASKSTTLLMNTFGYNEVKDIAPDGKQIAVVHADSRHVGEILIWQGGKISHRWRNEVDAFEADALFTADSKSMFYTMVGAPGTSQLMTGVLATEANKPAETQNGPVERIRMSEDRLRLLLVVNQNGASEIKGWEIDEQGHLRRSLKLPKRTDSVIYDAPAVLKANAPTEVRFFFTRSSPATPSQLYFWNGKTEEPWSNEGHVQTAACGPAPTYLTIPSKLAEGVPTYRYLPREADAHTPFVVYLHDGPDGQARPSFEPEIAYFTARGYGVLAINARGSGGYGRGFERFDNGSGRLSVADDLAAVAQWLRVERKNNAVPVFLYGRGSGAWLGANGIAAQPENFRALVAVDGIWDPPKLLSGMMPYQRKMWLAEWDGTPAITPNQKNTLVVQSGGTLATARQAVAFFEQRTVASKK